MGLPPEVSEFLRIGFAPICFVVGVLVIAVLESTVWKNKGSQE